MLPMRNRRKCTLIPKNYKDFIKLTDSEDEAASKKRQRVLTTCSDSDGLENKPTEKTRSKNKYGGKKNIEPDKVAQGMLRSVKKEPLSENEDFMSEDEKKTFSDFELIRQKNIEDRKRLFKELKINEAKKEFEEMVKKRKLRPSKISGIPKVTLPRRSMSLRIEGIKAEEPVQAAERVKSATRQSMSSYSYGDWGNEPRIIKAVLPMSETLLKNFNDDDCMKIVSSFSKKLGGFENHTHLKDIKIQNFETSMEKLTLKEQHKMKVVPSRIYSLAFHPAYNGILLAAGCKSGAVGLWNVNVESNDWDESQVIAFAHHVKPTNCVSFSETESHILYTSSYDCTMRRGDLHKQTFSLVHSTPENDRANHLTWHCELSPNVMLVAQGSGHVAKVDVREPSEKATLYKCHDRSVRTISLHPVTKQHIVTSSSSKKVVSLWDLRQMNSNGSQLSELSKIEFKAPPSSAFFSPTTGNRLLTTSYDNNISVYSCSDLSSPTLDYKVHHNNLTGRWVTNFRAVWHPHREDVFLVGSMARPRKMEVFHAGLSGSEPLVELQQPDLFTTIGAVAAFHPSLPAVVSGNGSGYLHLFM